MEEADKCDEENASSLSMEVYLAREACKTGKIATPILVQVSTIVKILFNALMLKGF